MTSHVACLQDRLARLLGLDPPRRTPLVRSMLHRPRGDAAGYWLQLFIAAALATLGLALDSTAVVIGAMLIAPLMRPIVELAMGLATGSAPLVFRTGIRSIVSVVAVVAASAAFTLLLPFHEVTGELLARTAPSLLDLFVAAACALAGAYAVVIASNDVATTAAGTSIGISLVPPLCTAGYGISIADWDMAVGAGLLFTANVTGIISVAGAVFVLVGFGQVDIREEERTLDDDLEVGAATRFGRSVSLRSARLGLASRVMLPVVLLVVIAYPLIEAVDEMSRRSAIRQQVAALLRTERDDGLVQYALDQTARPVSLRVVIVGDPMEARALEELLRHELAARGEPDAVVSVWAVSEASAVSALSARVEDLPAMLRPSPPPPPPPPPPPLDTRLRTAWPSENGGELVSVWISDGPPLEIRLAHLGPELGPAGREVLAKAVAIGTVPVIHETALPPLEVREGSLAWMDEMLQLLAHAGDHPRVHFCVTAPPVPPRPRLSAPERQFRERMTAVAGQHANIQIVEGMAWRVVPQVATCAEPVPPPAP